MTGRTHFAVGAAAGAVMAAVTDHPGWSDEAVIGTAVIAAMLPDLDAEESLIHQFLLRNVDIKMRRFIIGALGVGLILLTHYSNGFLLAGLFLLLAAVLPHRTITHSLLALGMITWVTYLLAPELASAAAVGYLSHLVADSMTPHGVPWLWPSKRRFRIARIPTGSGMDHAIGLTAFFGSFLLWLIF